MTKIINKKKPNGNNGNRLALEVRRVLKNMAETKVKSVAVAGTTTVLAGIVINISNNVAEGDDIFDRSGTKITLNRLDVRYRIFANTNSQQSRFILFRDMMNQGTTPAVTDIIPTATVTGHYSDTRIYQQKRFHVIDDWVVDTCVAGENSKHRVFSKLNCGSILYNGPTAVAASNGKGALFLLVIGTATTGTYDYDVTMAYNDS